jgi:WD40 repeat-containing protein SMU1
MSAASASSALDLSIDAADVLRLIQAHLTECGLHEACRALREESGVHAAGALSHIVAQWKIWAMRGDWGSVLTHLEAIDTKRIPSHLLGDVYEMTILELADNGDVQLAYATLRLVSAQLDRQKQTTFVGDDDNSNMNINIPRSRLVEQRLAALMAMRSANKAGLPRDFYGGSSMSKQNRRDELGIYLAKSVPQVPSSRLTALLQHAIKWQSYTGQLSVVKEHWPDDYEEGGETKSKKKRKRKFDLVLGESSAITIAATSSIRSAAPTSNEEFAEPIPSKLYSMISFGKKATAEVAVFLPDGSGLATGTSDGLVEIWSASSRYKELRMDLPYQQNENLLGHDDTIITAMTVSNDGAMLATGDATGLVKVWKIDNGKCLREVAAHPNSSISCIDFSHDASHILTASHDTLCREYGLRTNRMLKEFRGHSSFCNTCKYMLVDDNSMLRVITSSADGTARIYSGKTSEVLLVVRPFSLGTHMTEAGTSIVQKMGDTPNVEGSPNLHTVIPLHTPAETIVLVPRGSRAFLVSLTGVVLRIFDSSTPNTIFVAAAISPTNQWLYCATESGAMHVFHVTSGEEETVIRNFGMETCKSSSKKVETPTSSAPPEITSILHHPHKGIVGAFSSDKSQKRGVLALWK